MRTLILARHAHAIANESGLTSCVPPGLGLTPRGTEQAVGLRRSLERETIDLGVSSELLRARETLARAAPCAPRIVLPELNEIHFGQYEGRALDDYRAWAWYAPAHETCPGGGESRAVAAGRFARALEALLDRHEELVLAVGHALPLRYVLDAASGLVPAAHIDGVPHATPHRLDAGQVERAAVTLRSWSEKPLFRRSQARR